MPQRIWARICYSIALLFLIFIYSAVTHLHDKGGLPVDLAGGKKVEVNGTLISSPDQSEFMASWYLIGDSVHLKPVEGNEIARSSTGKIIPYYSSMNITLNIITAFVIFIVGFGVYVFHPTLPTTRLFYISSAITAIALLGVKTIYSVSPIWFGVTLATIFFLAYGLIPILFLHFTLLFPSTYTRIPTKLLSAGYGASLLIAVLHLIIYLHAARDRSMQGFGLSSNVAIIQNALSFIFLIAGVGKIVL
jgi:hypothetical protein